MSIYDPPTQSAIAQSLKKRMANRVKALDDAALHRFLADAVYQERLRFSRQREAPDDREQGYLDDAAQALRSGRKDMERSIAQLVQLYAYEIHNQFSNRTYEFATKLLPGALSRLLTATDVSHLASSFDPNNRIVVGGEVDLLRRLAERYTLIVAPTHVSNLDSPLIGYALFSSGLPPCIYGAGLNLFSNPALSFFMSRLGAYTVDRRKKHVLYKDVLKDYSIDALTRNCHSLFYPGGTRARSGLIEKSVKRGLLGTGITAWQEGLKTGKAKDVLFVPCTLSFALVLEAETLIEDSLAEQGKSRYIIVDDESADTKAVASFTSRVLQLDASVTIRLGRPLDPMGNPVDDEGRSVDPGGQPIDRRDYVTNRSGEIVADRQRDMVYTNLLADSLIKAYHRDNTVLDTHVAAFAAWDLLRKHNPGLDTFQVALLAPHERRFMSAELLSTIERLNKGIEKRVQAGAAHSGLGPGGAQAILERAVDRFGRFHTRRAIERKGNGVIIDPKLVLYYGNRLKGYGLEEEI